MRIGIVLFGVTTRAQVRTIRYLLTKHKPTALLLEKGSRLSKMANVMFRTRIPITEIDKEAVIETSDLVIATTTKVETSQASIFVRRDGLYQTQEAR